MSSVFFVLKLCIPLFLGDAAHEKLTLVGSEIRHDVLDEASAALPLIQLRLRDRNVERVYLAGQHRFLGDVHDARSLHPRATRQR